MTDYQIILIAVGVIILAGLAISIFVLKLTLPPHYKERLINIENRSRERMALIEKGMDPTLADKKENKSSGHESLVWGLLLIGIGFGALVGYIISFNYGWNQKIAMDSMALCFGGIGLVIYYLNKRKRESKKAA